MRKYESMRKGLSILLCLLMLVQYVPTMAFAAETDGLCEHHTEHTVECGYTPATAEVVCTHEHTEVCNEQVTNCRHTAHNETCGGMEAATCTHACSVDSGCVTTVLNCGHVENGSCCYVASIAETPCSYVVNGCMDCTASQTESTEGTTEPSTDAAEPAPVCNCGTDDPAIHATTCAVYVRPENPECFCAEKCTEPNVWCDVCGFDYTQCAGQDAMTAYDETTADPVTLDIANGTITISATGYKQYRADEIAYTGSYIITGTGTNNITVSGLAAGATITLKDLSITSTQISLNLQAAVPVAATGSVKLGSGTCIGSTGAITITGDADLVLTSTTNQPAVIAAGEVNIQCNSLSLTAQGLAFKNGVTTVTVDAKSNITASTNQTAPLIPCAARLTAGGSISLTAQNGPVVSGNADLTAGEDITLSTEGPKTVGGTAKLNYAGTLTETTSKGTATEEHVHSFENGICTGCGATCSHEAYEDGKCTSCGAECPHESYSDGKCTVCGSDCSHGNVNDYGICNACGFQFPLRSVDDEGTHSNYFTDLGTAVSYGDTHVDLLANITVSTAVEVPSNVTLSCVSFDITFTDAGSLTNNGTVVLKSSSTIPTQITGGTVRIGDKSYIWDNESEKYVCADGSHAYDPTTGLCACGAQAVAMVGDTFYTSLTDAAAAITAEGSTLTVFTDVTIGEGETLNFPYFVTLSVAEGKTITCNGTVTIGTGDAAKAGVIFQNALYYDGGDVTATGLSSILLSGPTYCKAGDGCVVFDGNNTLELHDATIYVTEVKNANEDYPALELSDSNSWDIKFSGTNNLTGASNCRKAYGINCGSDLAITAVGDDAVLNAFSGNESQIVYGITVDGTLTINGGTVNAKGGKPINSSESCGIFAVNGLVVNSGTVNATGGEAGLSVGVVAPSVSGNVNALRLWYSSDEENDSITGFVFTAMGNAVVAADMAVPSVEEGVTVTFAVPEGTTLTVNSGVTLDLSGLTLDAIDFSGTVVNNGTIILPADFSWDNAPKSGTVTINGVTRVWDSANSKWICAEGSHTGGTATCIVQAVCEVCGTSYGELAAHTPDANGKCTVADCGYQYAAMIGNTFYETMYTALRAAEENAGCTLILLDNITLTSSSSNASYVNKGTFTLDLNGKTLSSDKRTLEVMGSADLTIRDSVGGGKIVSTGSSSVYLSGGKLTIESGTFEGSLDGVFVKGTSETVTATIKGGTFSGSRAMITGYGSYCVIDLTNIDPAGFTLKNNGNGTFAPTLPEGYGMVGSDGKLLESLSAEQSASVHKHEYKYTDLGNGKHQQACSCGLSVGTEEAHTMDITTGKCSLCGYQYAVKRTVADGTSTFYATLEAAIKNAASGDRIELLSNVTVASDMEIPSGVSFDGCTFSVSKSQSSITIDNKGIIVGGVFQCSITNYGSITGGTFNSTVNQSSGGTIIGGSFSQIDLYGGQVSGTPYVGKITLRNSFSSRCIDLTQATFPDELAINNGYPFADAELNGILLLPDGYVPLRYGKFVTILEASQEANITKHSHSFRYTDNGDSTHKKACSECGYVEFVSESHTSGSYTADGATITEACTTCGAVLGTAAVTAESKTYDGTAVTATVIKTGALESETISVTYAARDGATLDSAPTDVGDYTASIKLDNAEAKISFEIKAVTPVITWGETSATVNYTGSPAAITAPTVTLLGNGFSSTISYSYTGTSGGEEVSGNGLPTNAGTYEITASIDAQGNYTAATSTNTLTLTIAPAAAPAIQWPTASSLTYGQKLSESALTSADTNGTFAWQDGSIVPTATNSGYVVVYTPKDTDNYDYSNITLTKTISVSVSKAEANIRWNSGYFNTYGANMYITAYINGVDGKMITGTAVATVYDAQGNALNSVTCTKTETSGTYFYNNLNKLSDGTYLAPGIYEVWVTFQGNENYLEKTVKLVEYTIHKRALTVTAEDNAITYGDAPTANGVSYAGFVDGETESVLGGELSYAYSYEQYGNVGTYTITPGGLTSDYYEITFVDGTLTVNAKAITVTAEAKSKTYGDADPELTFVLSEDALVDDDTMTGALSREAGTDVGTYAITQGTLTAGSNYTITFTGADFTITKRNVTITAKDQSITYGETISGTEITATGLVDGHSATVTLNPSTANVTVNGTITASAAVITADGTDVTGNYNVSYTSGKLVIEPDTSRIDALTTDNVTSTNEEDIKAVQAMMDSAETDGIDEATAEEWAEITANCEDLIEKIEAVEAENKALTDQVATFDEDTVKSTDKTVLEQLAQDIEDLLDTQNLTEDERTALEAVLEQVEGMIDTINETAEDSKAATDTINALDPATVTSDDKEALEQAIKTIDELLAEDHLTEDECKALEDARKDAEALLDVIEAAQDALDTENTEKVEDVTSGNVQPEDKEALEDAKADLEKALEDNASNYTEEEKQAIQDEIQRIEDAIEALENAEDVTDAITQLPDTVEPDDEEAAEKIMDAKEAYDELTDHEKSLVDDAAKKKLDDLVAALTAYDIIKGDGGKWTKGSSYGLSFTANGPFSKFVGIEVDGKEVDSKYYDAKAGSTIITLKQSFLKRLSTGEHTIAVLYTDGEASGTFKILAQSTSPATGDDSNIMLWSGMLCVSTLGLVVLLADRKRRRSAK